MSKSNKSLEAENKKLKQALANIELIVNNFKDDLTAWDKIESIEEVINR